ncbi:MAG: sigma-70 family RNA polymerase sigma factor [Deltaproteobacteria bacterium]|nr:sigma-70 family RNA polymerase sigma factor [Deltaproteobacteria bacterium]
MAQSQDTDFVERLKAKEASAMDELVDAYSDKIYHLAMGLLKKEQDAEDVVQDTLLQVIEKIHTFRGEAALSSWIYRIAINFSYMKIRKIKRHDYIPIEEHMPKFEKSGMHEYPVSNWADKADNQLVRKEMRQLIMENIDKLSEKYKTVLVMRDIQGLSTEEVADATGMTIPAVKSRLHRARLFLRDRLARYYKG